MDAQAVDWLYRPRESTRGRARLTPAPRMLDKRAYAPISTAWTFAAKACGREKFIMHLNPVAKDSTGYRRQDVRP
jgi:hypothetical protein